MGHWWATTINTGIVVHLPLQRRGGPTRPLAQVDRLIGFRLSEGVKAGDTYKKGTRLWKVLWKGYSEELVLCTRTTPMHAHPCPAPCSLLVSHSSAVSSVVPPNLLAIPCCLSCRPPGNLRNKSATTCSGIMRSSSNARQRRGLQSPRPQDRPLLQSARQRAAQ